MVEKNANEANSEFTVPERLNGERLDRAAAQLATGLSRARLKRAIEGGAVRVNGKRRPKGATVATGDVIAIDTTQVSDADSPAEATPDEPLLVGFEGEGVLVVDKPAGQPTAPLRAGETGALANALVGRYPELAGIGYSAREPGLVHRLDTDTSGLVLVARTKEAFEVLRAALKEDRIEKRYLLLCASADLPDEGSIEFPIANHPKDQRRVYPCIHPRDVMRYAPRPASTFYRVVQRGSPWALVEVTVSRALRHQIRAHFAAIDHPLAGDVLYGGAEIRSLGRHALHASRIAFTGAPGVAKFDVTSPLPPAMASLVTVTADSPDAPEIEQT
ncbi:pseudouridine synthase [Pendulispora albinea]|uniref:RluA family pseudouridine synthase n=1 Tax=Pendulispora albinea TaxID=2741071 RepID=A0ABZ2LSQ2_9BACT